MTEEIGQIWKDVQSHRYLESYLVVLASIVVLIAGIAGVEVVNALAEITLAVLSVLVYLSIKERREYRRLGGVSDVEGICWFRMGRRDMPGLDAILERAESDILLYAVMHSTLVHTCMGVLEEQIRHGCTARILMMAPRSDCGETNPNVASLQNQRTQAELLPVLEANTKALIEWRDSLAAELRSRVELRQYWEYPCLTYLLIDVERPQGFGVVEVFAPGLQLMDLPHYQISQRHDAAAFKLHCESADYVWKRATPVD